MFDSEILFLGLDPTEMAPDTEKDVCYGVIYNSKNKTAKIETSYPFIGGEREKSAPSSGRTSWQHASYEEQVITRSYSVAGLEMTVT